MLMVLNITQSEFRAPDAVIDDGGRTDGRHG